MSRVSRIVVKRIAFRARGGGARRSVLGGFRNLSITSVIFNATEFVPDRWRRSDLVGQKPVARMYPQRVTVKSRVVKHSKYSGGGGAAAALREHIQYLGRGGVAEEGGRGLLFDGDGDLSPNDARAFRDAIVDDRHHFRFIVSPEAGSALELKDYAREFVATLEADVGTELQWLGVAHYDTDNPHLHLLVRGKDDHGGDLVINRDYISHGMRLQAMELATQHVGPRLPEDVELSVVCDLKADRVTGIDLRLAQAAATHPHGWVSALTSNDRSLAGERQRLHTLTRLQHLESLGLAREVKPGIWQPDIDLVARLRTLSTRDDIIKRMHERMQGGGPSISTVIFNKEHPPTTPVIGRVYGRGTIEFPRLSRMPFFSDALSYVAGYNIKVMLMMQSKGQLDAPDSYGKGNTIIESCRIRSLYTPQDPDTAQWISDSLGPKTEVHQQTTYTGHRLAPWLGHVMVADQESSRPLLDAAEICKLPATDAIILVADFPPFKAKRLKYYEDPILAERAALPALTLKPGAPYPFRPRQRANPWMQSGQVTAAPAPTAGAMSPPMKSPAAVMGRAPTDSAGGALPQETDAEVQMQFELDAQQNAQLLAQALEEHERVTQGRHRKHRQIPL